MIQLVSPNLNATGSIGYCLAYAGPGMFGTTYVPNPPFAWTAWEQTEFRLNTIPTDVAVPCWFSYYTPSGQQQGHVVISVPGKGFYSSPWAIGTNHAVLASIADVERIYHCIYVGCSLDILNLKVAEDYMPVWNNGDTYNLLYRSINIGAAETAKNANYEGYFGAQAGQEYKSALETIINSLQYGLMVQSAQVRGDYIAYAGSALYTKK